MPLSRLDVFRICQEKYILIFGGIFVLGMILATVASHLEEVNWVLFWIGGGLAIIGFIPLMIFSLRAAFLLSADEPDTDGIKESKINLFLESNFSKKN